ncbi:DUF5642 family protein [Mycolicibacterium sp. S2-37]|uniref:DUF5642 family protein n=1 Tax=Mycolicibacterium sp. S2-37 TaxID=2810297 RepID=UPI001A94BD38|nr:DUF5642 family protein [Mycolicibacterium sp. S2-37]MBO0679329.1 DUF5642 family protein [Mycolicibacterium sp. S2-37]
MRHIAAVGAAAAVLAACGTTSDGPAPDAPPETSAVRGVIDPARIDRARYQLPPDYEVTDVSGRVTPTAQWGFGPGWRADPQPCGALSDPVVDPATLRGWSASGAGGIVYAVAAAGATGIDPVAVGECASWRISAGPSSGSVRLVEAPAVDGAQTVAMAAESLTVVEGGTETRSQATTVMASEGGHLVYVTVVTDPGSPTPALEGGFAADLLTETVAALRK